MAEKKTDKPGRRLEFRWHKRRGRAGWFRWFGCLGHLELAFVLVIGVFAAALLTSPPDGSPSLAFAEAYGESAEASTERELSETTPLVAEARVEAAGADIPANSMRQTDRALLNTAVICLTVTTVLGFLLTVKNRRRQNTPDEWPEQNDEPSPYHPPHLRRHDGDGAHNTYDAYDARDAYDTYDARRKEIKREVPAR